jgi:Bacterial Ig-like domain
MPDRGDYSMNQQSCASKDSAPCMNCEGQPFRALRQFVAFLSALLFCFASYAATPTESVFGPKIYRRTTGTPITVTDTVHIPAGVTAPFLLRIENGAPAVPGATRVVNGTITLNGVQIASTADFGSTVTLINKAVNLTAGANTLSVRLTGTPGSAFLLRILGTRILTVPTGLTPNPLAMTAGTTVNLTAALSPAPLSAGSLTISSANTGVANVPASGAFSAGQTSVVVPVSGVGQGSTTVNVSLNGSSRGATVNVAAPPPTVASLTPVTLAITQGSSGTLTVTLSSAPATATIVALASSAAGVATAPASVTVAAGSLTTTVPVTTVAPGTTQITATLNDSSQSASVNVAPALSIFGQVPKDVILAGGSKPEIGAAYSVPIGAIDVSRVSLVVNGQNVSAQALITPTGVLYIPSQGLANGTYNVTLTVGDLAGNVATNSWSFTVSDPAPSFYEESPRDVFIVDAQPVIRVLFSGFNIAPASVKIFLDDAEVTAQASVGAGVINYTPGTPLAAGLHTVKVSAIDGRGVAAEKVWSFTVQILPPPDTTTDGDRTPRSFIPELRLPP